MIDFGIAQPHQSNLQKSPSSGRNPRLSVARANRADEPYARLPQRFLLAGRNILRTLTGRLPFPTRDILELVHCHIAKPCSPQEVNAKIPKPVSDMILKLMAKNAEDRYQSAWGIKADLERCPATGRNWSNWQHPIKSSRCFEQFHIPQKTVWTRSGDWRLLAFDRVAGSGNQENSFKVEMMLVSGYAGIGKSALVQELYKPLTAAGLFYLG